jgi:tripartite-type tricarboxylate transporter receptor subunit TctC
MAKLFALFVSIAALFAGAAHAQTWPLKPIRIVTTETGTGNDLIARLMAPHLSAALGHQVVVENRGISASEFVARSPADGYTLLSYGSPLWLLPFMREVRYDPVKDFAPITLAADSPNLLVVHPSLPVKTVRELIALARAKPGELNYSSSSTGATPHLAAELFKSMTGVNIVRIAYKGSGQALTSLIGGQVQLMFPNVGAAAAHLKSTRLRALAVTTAQPSALAPGLPTLAASGVPGYESSAPFGVFAPAGTAPIIIERLQREMVTALRRPDLAERMQGAGVEVVASTPAELAATMKAEMVKWGKLIKEAGIRED